MEVEKTLVCDFTSGCVALMVSDFAKRVAVLTSMLPSMLPLSVKLDY